jgi:Ser/Thr protein kinase RdoA (MazF antagonist)
MMQQEWARRQEIEHCLKKMHRSPEQLQAYQILQEGISGAATYRLQMTGEELVLKVTSMESERSVRERAQRELSFYQTLAPRLTLHAPQMVAHVRDTKMIALLLAVYEPSAPPIQWQERQYLQVAEQLAQLHASFWKNTELVTHLSWLRREQWTLSGLQLHQAAQQWQALQNNPGFHPLIPRQRYQRVVRLLSLMGSVESLLTSFPLTVCHGDCHIDNLLRDRQGHLVWADWQEVGVGPGPTDLSFFYQRAFKAGGTVPFEAMISTYHQHLEAQTREQLPFALLQQVLDVLELRAWLLTWPAYLMDVSPQWLTSLFHRIDLLADQLHLVVQQENT